MNYKYQSNIMVNNQEFKERYRLITTKIQQTMPTGT